MKYYDVQYRYKHGFEWHSGWLTADLDTQRALFRDFMFRRDNLSGLRLVAVTPPPDCVPIEVLEFWEDKA